MRIAQVALIEPLHNHEGNESKGNESTSEHVGLSSPLLPRNQTKQ